MYDDRVRFELDEQRIDGIFARLDQCHAPGCVVGIAVDGKPVYRKGFGLANLDAPVALMPSTRLRVGSVTKQFTCLTYLLLCEERKARLDDPLGQYLPELHPVTHAVTIRQLMDHTSGLRDAYSIFLRFNDPHAHYAGPAQSVSSRELLDLYRTIDDVEAPPGTAWSYNNGCYLLLSAVIERITGEPLETTMADRVFVPIGLHDSMLMRSDIRFIGNRGSQHVVSPEGGFQRMYWGVDNFLGGGAALSTVDDLLRWLAHMDRPTVGRAETWREMLSCTRLANGTLIPYGLGVNVERYRGATLLSHSGGAFGGGAHVLRIPDAALDVAVVSNRQDAYAPSLAQQIVDECLVGGVKTLVSLPRGTSRPVTGTFRSSASGSVVQLSDREGQQLVSIDGLDLIFEQFVPGKLRRAGEIGAEGWTITLPGSHSNPETLRFDHDGSVDEFASVDAGTLAADRSILGDYLAAAIDTRAMIGEESQRILLHTRGRFGSVTFQLTPLSSGIWRAQSLEPFYGVGVPAGILTFGTDYASFRFSTGTTRSLRFDRRA
jgi:D-aminopeptidase